MIIWLLQTEMIDLCLHISFKFAVAIVCIFSHHGQLMALRSMWDVSSLKNFSKADILAGW